jgi:hypothetical protein
VPEGDGIGDAGREGELGGGGHRLILMRVRRHALTSVALRATVVRR